MVPGALGEVKDLLGRHPLAVLREVAGRARAAATADEARAVLAELTA